MSGRPQRPVVLVTAPVHEEVRARLQPWAELDINEDTHPWPAPELRRRAGRARAMMAFMPDRVDAAFLAAAPHLGLVACALKGFDNFDTAACTDAGVWLSIVPDLLTEPTAELALGLAIALGRHVLAGDAQVRAGGFAGWRPQLYGAGLAGVAVAVVGLGRVGSAIVERLRGFGCAQLLGVDPEVQLHGVRSVTLAQALAQADYSFIAAPLLPSTRHLIAAEQLACTRPGQLMVNVGRGSVVDEAAVAQALQQGRLGGYAADVFECEDWALADRPGGVNRALLAHPRTLFTPHLGSAVTAVRRAIEHRAADNIIAFLQGRCPPDAVNQPAAAQQSANRFIRYLGDSS